MLSALKKSNRNLVISVEEWKRFCENNIIRKASVDPGIQVNDYMVVEIKKRMAI